MIPQFNEREFLVDESGKKLGVVINISDYQKILEQLEELESIQAYDAAIASNDTKISFSDAVSEIENSR
jgi:hypothetical protein